MVLEVPPAALSPPLLSVCLHFELRARSEPSPQHRVLLWVDLIAARAVSLPSQSRLVLLNNALHPAVCVAGK